MWIVILNFCLFILLIGFMFYGFGKWTELITDYDDNSEDVKNASGEQKDETSSVVDETYYRLPMWILFIGIGFSQVIIIIQNLIG